MKENAQRLVLDENFIHTYFTFSQHLGVVYLNSLRKGNKNGVNTAFWLCQTIRDYKHSLYKVQIIIDNVNLPDLFRFAINPCEPHKAYLFVSSYTDW